MILNYGRHGASGGGRWIRERVAGEGDAMNTDKSATNRSSVPAGYKSVAVFHDELMAADRELTQLMDMLAALRDNLTGDVMARAARITGTTARVTAAVRDVDAAARMAKRARQRIAGSHQRR